MTDRMEDSVILTDDEIAAVAFTTRRPWRRPLLTIENSERAFANATARGFRSLGLRGLVSDAGFSDQLLAEVAALSGHQPVLVAVAVNDDLSWRTDAERWELFAGQDGDRALSCISTADGIHIFAWCDFRPAALTFGEFVQQRPERADRDAAIAVLVRDVNGAHLDSYLARAGEISVMHPGAGGRLPPAPVASVDWSAVIDTIEAAGATPTMGGKP